MELNISTLLITLLISSVILPTMADAQATGGTQPSVDSSANNQPTAKQLSPFELAFLAYQGNLKPQGIPSYGALLDAIAFRSVTAQQVMQAAVRANELPAQTLTDRGYRFALQSQLDGLIRRR